MSKKYQASNIKVLKGLDAVRNAQECLLVIPMTALGFITWFLRWSDNSIDEALAGYCTEIEIVIN
jgi:DNA gyrase subunit B